jgi:DNA-binding NarL/FixJ family response regulator
MATALLVYEHHILRRSLRGFLESQSELAVIGEASDGDEAVRLAHRLQPDLVIMDSWLRGLSAQCATRRIVQTCPRSRVLIVPTRGPHNSVENWVRSGISGYLLEDSTPEELIQAVDAVAKGKGYLCPTIAQRVLEAASRPKSTNGTTPYSLTSREAEVLQLVAEGLSTKEVATKLGIAFRTAESYRTAAMSKLGIHKVSDLVRFAVREGLVVP